MFSLPYKVSQHQKCYDLVKFVRKLSISFQLSNRVSVIGAAGGVGQVLSMLLKISPLVKTLNIHDIEQSPGIAMDLSHINTKACVKGFKGTSELDDALEGADIVVLAAGVPRKPGMTRDDLFKTNASIVKVVTTSITRNCPKALIAIVTNPVNSMVPISAEVLKEAGCFDPRKLFGVTTLDLVRASTFAGALMCADPAIVTMPVIGGHSGKTIIPIISQCKPKLDLPREKIQALTERIQEAGTEVVQAKAGKGSATLSAGYAAARFVFSLCRGLRGESNIVECTYVKSELTDARYFASPVILGRKGLKKNLGFGKLNNYECKLLNVAIPILIKDIEKGEKFVKKKKEGDPCP